IHPMKRQELAIRLLDPKSERQWHVCSLCDRRSDPGRQPNGATCSKNRVYEANNVNACIGKVRDDLCFVKNKEALLLKSRIPRSGRGHPRATMISRRRGLVLSPFMLFATIGIPPLRQGSGSGFQKLNTAIRPSAAL